MHYSKNSATTSILDLYLSEWGFVANNKRDYEYTSGNKQNRYWNTSAWKQTRLCEQAEERSFLDILTSTTAAVMESPNCSFLVKSLMLFLLQSSHR